MNNEVKNVVIEIVDLETGEILLTSRKQRMLYSYGLQGLNTFFDEFHSLLRSGRNCTINVSAFDLRYSLCDAENQFITFKHIPDVY